MSIHGVHEAEPAHRVSVRKKMCAVLPDELVPPAQFLAADLHVPRIVVQRGRHRDHREFSARDTGGFENALIAHVEAINLSFDQLLDRVRDADLDRVDRARQLPALFMRLDQPFGDQVLDRVHHEERVALAALVDQRGKVRRKPVDGEPGGEVLPHSLLGQVFEWQFFALPTRSKLLLHRLERVPARNQLRRPVGPDHHQVRSPTPAGDVRDQVQRREVAPVKVFQHEHQRRKRRQRIEHLAHFPQHPLARRAKCLAAEEIAIG